jgi:nifR3 family TIM-barrel protein
MVSAKGLHYHNANTFAMVETHPDETPCAVQLFGSDPGIMAQTAAFIEREYGQAIGLIDINMGCPAPKITRNGEGSALMQNMALASDIIRSVVQAVCMPVTVKFRKGWDEHSVNAVEFACMARQSGAAAVCVHGRTRAQVYHGQADWEIIAKVRAAVDIPVIGNGDIFSPQDAMAMMNQTGCHAVMVARGAQGNPWIFRQIAKLRDTGEEESPPTAIQRVEMALFHARKAVAYKGAYVAVREMRKHVAWYIKGMRDAAKVRSRVNCARTLGELEDILMQLRETFQTKDRFS